MKPIYFNGKFYGASLNGVHRVADRLIREVDALLAALPDSDRPDATLFVPTGSRWLPELKNIRIVEHRRAASQLWEQAILPRLASRGVLVNLCNLAPIAHRNKILLLHDAQFLFPDSSYPLRQRLGYRLLVPMMAKGAGTRVLTVSEYSRQILDLMKVVPREKTAILYNGADHMTEVPVGVLDRSLGLHGNGYVVIFGSSKQYKNVSVVFDAFRDPRLSDLKLVVLGEGRDALIARGISVPDSAIFVGRIDDGVLRALYGDALCIAFPSKTEGFGLPPIEAAFCGCPSVVAPAGAIPEICQDGVLYAGVDGVEEWIAAFRTYADNAELRTAKVAQIRRRAEQFQWAVAGAGLFGHICDMVGLERNLSPSSDSAPNHRSRVLGI